MDEGFDVGIVRYFARAMATRRPWKRGVAKPVADLHAILNVEIFAPLLLGVDVLRMNTPDPLRLRRLKFDNRDPLGILSDKAFVRLHRPEKMDCSGVARKTLPKIGV